MLNILIQLAKNDKVVSFATVHGPVMQCRMVATVSEIEMLTDSPCKIVSLANVISDTMFVFCVNNVKIDGSAAVGCIAG